jgi:hypothetical protein
VESLSHESTEEAIRSRIAGKWLGARQVSVLALDGVKIMTPNGPW